MSLSEICRESKINAFLAFALKRNKDTLSPIITLQTQTGAKIITDRTRAYDILILNEFNHLRKLPETIFNPNNFKHQLMKFLKGCA
ncbi:hypothetical protein HZS_5422 [Henneguya salminicola]|nr:hypothetical protein HZS_5422 [Henneguya salminicola]